MPGAQTPRNVVFVLLDSLNRDALGAYGGTEWDTPNLDTFARGAIRFDRHYSGALPCMPARHDLLCGTWDFMWKPWGSIEIWEEPITDALRREGVCTKLVSDHPHLFESGGENYHVGFTAWTYERGHEGDPWRTRPDVTWLGAPSFGRGWLPYDNSRAVFRREEDFPGAKCMSAAARWLDEEAPTVSGRESLDERFPHDAYRFDRFMLFVDEFDPHEPFDTPEPYASMYDPDWVADGRGPHLIWPPYTRVGSGVLDAAQARQVRAQYGGKVTMIDAWFGRVMDALDRGGYWDDTAVIVTTDHGHYLGERDAWGKPPIPVFETMGHIPLLVRWPGAEGGVIDALTTSVDLAATIVDIFGGTLRHRSHGRSLAPLITGEQRSVREWALSGVWGREVHLLWEGKKYARAPEGTNFPLSMWSNRWTTMPVWRFHDLKLPPPDDRATLDRMPGSTVPVIRQPFREGDMLPFWALGEFFGNQLFDVDADPNEERNLAGTSAEKVTADLLRDALTEIEAPSDQFERLGLI